MNMAGNPRQLLPLPPISNVAAARLHSLRCFTKWFSKCGNFFDMTNFFAWIGNHFKISLFSLHRVNAIIFPIFLGIFVCFLVRFLKTFIWKSNSGSGWLVCSAESVPPFLWKWPGMKTGTGWYRFSYLNLLHVDKHQDIQQENFSGLYLTPAEFQLLGSCDLAALQRWGRWKIHSGSHGWMKCAASSLSLFTHCGLLRYFKWVKR